jgi:hypothetical protein
MKSAPGWWVAFGARLDVNSTPETAHESERIVLHFHGPRVHDGDPFSWELTTGLDHLGVRRLVLLDNATYPKPLCCSTMQSAAAVICCSSVPLSTWASS